MLSIELYFLGLHASKIHLLTQKGNKAFNEYLGSHVWCNIQNKQEKILSFICDVDDRIGGLDFTEKRIVRGMIY